MRFAPIAVSILIDCVVAGGEVEQTAPRPMEGVRIKKLEEIGATVFKRDDRVVEVVANRTSMRDDDLKLVAGFAEITDLSLEETQVGSAGLAHLRRLKKLEWLNLYRSRVGDDGLKHLKSLENLQHLPVGETAVTDAGLAHLQDMPQLLYLGLRANEISDQGIEHLHKLTNLQGAQPVTHGKC